MGWLIAVWRRRLRQASVVEIERMLGLYRDLYRGFTAKHFHEWLLKRHNYVLSIVTLTWHRRHRVEDRLYCPIMLRFGHTFPEAKH